MKAERAVSIVRKSKKIKIIANEGISQNFIIYKKLKKYLFTNYSKLLLQSEYVINVQSC